MRKASIAAIVVLSLVGALASLGRTHKAAQEMTPKRTICPPICSLADVDPPVPVMEFEPKEPEPVVIELHVIEE